MGILNSEMKYRVVLDDLDRCCLKEGNCGACIKENCIIGYAQNCTENCEKEEVTFVEDGSEHIPFDTKLYNEDDLVTGIAHILRQCKSCDTDHFENCIINIIRNCYEIGLFGETLTYKGSAFQYLNQIHMMKPEIAGLVIEAFHNTPENLE